MQVFFCLLFLDPRKIPPPPTYKKPTPRAFDADDSDSRRQNRQDASRSSGASEIRSSKDGSFWNA